MDAVYAAPGAAALVEWLLACALYALGWYRTKHILYRVGDSLVLAGLVAALAGVAWLSWELATGLALTTSSLATGLASSALIVYAVLAHPRTERLSACMVLSFAVLVQAYALGRLWWGVEVVPPGVFLPGWMALQILAGLAGGGALVVSAGMIILSFTLLKLQARLSPAQWSAGARLGTLERSSWQIALVALSLSLSIGLIRSWWGWGRPGGDGFAWSLVTWLLLTAAVYGLMQGALSRRLARALLVVASGMAIIAVLTTG